MSGSECAIKLLFVKVIEKCTNFYFGTKKLPPKFSELISIVKNFWYVGHQIVFQCEIWYGSVAKFVTLSVFDDIRIISVINRVASKNNLTTKPVQYVLRLFVLLILLTLKMPFRNIINLSVAPIGRRNRDVWNIQSARYRREIGFWDIF